MDEQTITLILSAVILILSIVSPLINPFLRIPRKSRTREPEEQLKKSPMSIVIISHDNAYELEKHIPLYLQQDYDSDFEIIIVADKSDVETENVIQRFSNHKNLHSTFMPLSSRYISRKKLAITLGIKAAHYQWVIVTDALCYPTNDGWLSTISKHCTDSYELVLGFTRYEDSTPALYHYDHLRNAYYNLHHAYHYTAYGQNSSLIAIKKDTFLENDGFLGNLKYNRGEYDFLTNKFSQKGTTDISIEENAILNEVTPSKKRWNNLHLYSINSQQSMQRGTAIKLLYHCDMTIMHLTNIITFTSIIYSILDKNYILLVIATFSILLSISLRIYIGKRAISYLNVKLSSWIVPLFDYTQSFRNIIWRIKYLFANKTDFITHKL